ncbi:MAG: hypothetical protein R3D71_10035 [Rickettsiales bacterium]
MKKTFFIFVAINIFLGLCFLSFQTFANKVTVRQLFIEYYNPINREYYTLRQGSPQLKEEPYNYILTSLKTQLVAIDQETVEYDNDQADYHVIFIDIPYTYQKEFRNRKFEVPNIDPPLPKNKYKDDKNITSYRFVSPWVRGTIYIKGKKPIGGTIIFPISNMLRMKELYYASHGDWNKFSKGNPTNLDDVTMSYENIYQPALEKYIRIFLDSSSGRPTEEQIDKVFSPDGIQTLFWARIARLAPQTTIVRFTGGGKIVECLRRSKVYYINIYKYILEEILKKSITETDNNIIYSITPPVELLKSIHNSSGDYNCFSKYIKETSK